MERIGTIIETTDEKAKVRLDGWAGRDSAGALEVYAENKTGAAEGGRVMVSAPEPLSAKKTHAAYLFIPAAILAGIIAGKVVSGMGWLKNLAVSIAGEYAGGLIAGGDNLMLLGGLLGAGAAFLILAPIALRARDRALLESRVVQALDEGEENAD